MAVAFENYSFAVVFQRSVRFLSRRWINQSSTARDVFEKERLRRLDYFQKNVEKIKVNVEGMDLLMNRLVSTPYDCARHLREHLSENSVVAMVNGTAWNLHRPLKEDCSMEFVPFRCKCPEAANLAFWRSCSVLLGMIMLRSFKDDVSLTLVKSGDTAIESMSFTYDMFIKTLHESTWMPSDTELHALSIEGQRLAKRAHPINTMDVSKSFAAKLFENSPYKLEQVEAGSDEDDVTVCCVDDYVDICSGPLMSNTALIGRYMVTAVHPIGPADTHLYRAQGLAIPRDFLTHFTSFDILAKYASERNGHPLPELMIRNADV